MHHQDFSGDPAGTGSRKAAYHYRRGSSGASSGNTADDNPPQAGSSSPGLHQHQSQSQSQATGAQVKKKSGFQITSVTSAQINVSGNNSLADDTESYDDMDESHTEDLSSSDMLDVSVSRATDMGVPERSSSDETLNSLHGVDTPGVVSPNEPLHPHSIPQGSQQHTAMVNGTVHQHYYPPQHSQPHHHPSDSLEGGEPSLPAIPVANSSPAMASKAGPSQSLRPQMLDNSKPATQPVAAPAGGTEPYLQGSAAALPPSGPAGLDNPNPPFGGGTAPSSQSQHSHTQTGSRFRVVKLDTNSEPFRKGRWTCTEYYEKEVAHATASETAKGGEVAAETEAGSAGLHQGGAAAQPPHTLQPYQLPSQDFTSPQAMQSPPQGPAQATPVTYGSPQEAVSGAHMQQPVTLQTATPQTGVNQPPAAVPQQLPYAVEPHQAQPQGGYPAPQFHIAPGSVRQPDFIQPTAPFQTQVQPPLPQGVLQQPLRQPQSFPVHPQPLSSGPVPVASAQATPYMPLTALQADLQPLLTLGSTRTSQLEDAQKLLLQHQGLLALPRLGAAAGGDGAAEAGGAAGALAHMGMSAEASALMVAAGLRTQHGEGEEDSSSGASVVAIDNKIEQAMDLVKSHLMFAVREEVEVLKEQIKELIERNTQLEQENNLLKNLASPEQMAQFQAQVQTGGSPTGGAAQPPVQAAQVLPPSQSSGTSA